jgi:uncharacterized protein YchJ
MVRANWISDHPSACTCSKCEEQRVFHHDHGKKIGRNTICPCGSNKKYKKCHGA